VAVVNPCIAKKERLCLYYGKGKKSEMSKATFEITRKIKQNKGCLRKMTEKKEISTSLLTEKTEGACTPLGLKKRTQNIHLLGGGAIIPHGD